MRVVIVTDTFPPDINGVAMTLGRLVSGLRSRGHLVYVTRTGEKHGPGETVVKSVPLPGYSEVKVGLSCKTKLTRRWLRKRPDVVYVATESPLGFSAIKAANALNIPVAAGFHTNFHHYLQNYRMAAMEKGALHYLRRVHALADCTVVPSVDVKASLLTDGFSNVHVIGRGVDVDLFHPSKRCARLRAEWGARSGTPVAILVGRVAAEKNLPFAMEVIDKMRESVPDLVAVVVGDGPLRESLMAKHSHVIFAGAKRGEELARHYASADILLFPSETETFGNVLLEGMASGNLVVAYDYAAASLHLENERNGFSVVKGDQDQFVEKALQAACVDQYEMVRAHARNTADQLGWAAIVGEFESLLNGLVQHSGKVVNMPHRRRKMRVRTLFLSDIHLGTDDSKAREVIYVLKHVRCEKIVLNGDIIDVWALKRGKKWRSIHTRVIRTLLKKMEKEKTEIIYLRGNHDDFMERFLPITLGRLRCVKEYVHESATGKKYLVLHGDGFDSVSTGHKWVAMLGAVGYDFLLRVNRVYNAYRRMRGKEHYSVSKAIKGKVKSAVSFVSRYEEKLVELAHKRGCSGIICGHIHTPADEVKHGVHYLNSGDWVETMSCIVEDEQGEFSVLYYEDVVERTLPRQGVLPMTIERKVMPSGQDRSETSDRAALSC